MKTNRFQLTFILFLSFVIILSQSCSPQPAITSFSTNGHTVYHLEPASVQKGKNRVIISAAYDGTILCHNTEGKLIWKTKPSEGFPFDLAVGDLNGDGLDETMVASSDGNLYVLDSKGQIMWTLIGHAPLYQVCMAKDEAGSPVVFTGGVERELYALSPEGAVLSKYKADGVIRLIGKGNILGDGKDYLAVATSRAGLSGNFTLRLHNTKDLKPLWEKPMSANSGNRGRFYSLQIFDLDGDEKEEMVFGMTHSNSGEIAIFDYEGNRRILPTCKDIIPRPYKMNFISHIKSPVMEDEYMLNLSGHNLLVFDMDGTCRNILQGPYSFAGTAFDPQTGTYWMGSGISGGDGIYGIHLDKPGWEEAFPAIKPVGKMDQLEKNMAELLHQAEAFIPPSYQKETPKTLVVIEESPEWDYDQSYQNLQTTYLRPYGFKNVNFAPFVYSHESYHHFKEWYDPGITDPKMRAEWEGFHSGRIWTKEKILQFAKDRERAGEDFFIYAGHGRSFGIDFYLSPETLAEMLVLSPNTLQGFVFAEMENTDEYMEKAIKEQLLPLADLCYEHGKKKIFLRNKNIFWNGNIHLDMFKPIMADERYREIFVPSMEETNSRNQSLSLAGRTGLWMSGKFKHMTGRAVTDNANYNRSWEWGQTKHLSQVIRKLSLNRVMGADIFHINIVTDNATEMLPFYLMLEKGILPLPRPEDILSMADITIGVTSPDKDFVRHGTNGHGLAQYSPDEGEFVFDRLACYWGGALLPDHDFERYALNAKRRMTNFIAQSPYGNMTTLSAETDLSDFPFFRKMLVTNGKYWYDAEGNSHSPAAYKPVVMAALEESASRLPVRVFGEVAWAAIRIDPSHIRLVLIDPGYLDPADREAEVIFQHLEVMEAKDILSGETISLKDDRFSVKVPMGILRVIDLKHN